MNLGRPADRATDELALHMLEKRHAGVSAKAIGEAIGRTGQFVSTATKRVADVDRAVEDCTGFYGWRA